MSFPVPLLYIFYRSINATKILLLLLSSNFFNANTWSTHSFPFLNPPLFLSYFLHLVQHTQQASSPIICTVTLFSFTFIQLDNTRIPPGSRYFIPSTYTSKKFKLFIQSTTTTFISSILSYFSITSSLLITSILFISYFQTYIVIISLAAKTSLFTPLYSFFLPPSSCPFRHNSVHLENNLKMTSLFSVPTPRVNGVRVESGGTMGFAAHSKNKQINKNGETEREKGGEKKEDVKKKSIK